MLSTTPSRTSAIAAIMRAIHQTADDEPKILVDPVAPRPVEPGGQHAVWLSHPFARRWRSGFLLRSRYAEDCLAEAVRRGVQQYLILGAGKDNPELNIAVKLVSESTAPNK